ncbi:unnamed protein product [Euphydryas editha]|uniref:28S ribosomal protein S24, mitochondrial n=1 Tax=Euphydryas editha TaxID=104508 RepID=A0AAU9THA4_EUPED|nr:unnamed protein product [Euphydryas editha]
MNTPTILKLVQPLNILSKCSPVFASQFHTSSALCRVVSGKYRITKKRDRPLTYEMANPPHYIAHRKSWNSWNTSSLKDGLRKSETAVEDEFIRRFINGTWHGLVCSEVYPLTFKIQSTLDNMRIRDKFRISNSKLPFSK